MNTLSETQSGLISFPDNQKYLIDPQTKSLYVKYPHPERFELLELCQKISMTSTLRLLEMKPDDYTTIDHLAYDFRLYEITSTQPDTCGLDQLLKLGNPSILKIASDSIQRREVIESLRLRGSDALTVLMMRNGQN